MKQFIVLITTIILGIALAVMIMGFKKPADTMGSNINAALENVVTQYTSPAAAKLNNQLVCQ